MVDLPDKIKSLTPKEIRETVLKDGPLKLDNNHDIIACPELENSICLISFVENPVTQDIEALCSSPLFKEDQMVQHSSCKYGPKISEE